MRLSRSAPSSLEAVCRRLQVPGHLPSKILIPNSEFRESPAECRQVTSLYVSQLNSLPTRNHSIQSRREQPCLVFPASKTTRMRASDSLQGQPAANICLREAIEAPDRHHLHTPLQLQLQAVDPASDERIRSLHLEGFQLRGKMLPHILWNDQSCCINSIVIGLPNRRLPKSAYAFFSAAVFHLRS